MVPQRRFVYVISVCLCILVICWFFLISYDPPGSALGVAVVSSGIAASLSSIAWFYGSRSNLRTKSFSDVDNVIYNLSPQHMEQIKMVERRVTNLEEVHSYQSYFTQMRGTLEAKARSADEKASILLEKGTRTAAFGITVYIVAILLWQWLYHDKEQFTFNMYVGVVSSSLLFIAIELISAWYLKQYRYLIDTSTNLMKVKSLFDRYLLAYHLVKEFKSDGVSAKELLEFLRMDVSFPALDGTVTGKVETELLKEIAGALSAGISRK